MFCFQCEQADKGEGCSVRSTCGKTPEVAALQDLLIHALKGLSVVALEAREHDIVDEETDAFTYQAIFSTLTNVNFDAPRFETLIREAVDRRDTLATRVEAAGGRVDRTRGPVTFTPADDLAGLIGQGQLVGVPSLSEIDADLRSLKETLVYGIKGTAAYAAHALKLDKSDAAVASFIYKGLAATLRGDTDVEGWLGHLMECGQVNLRAMELLDEGHTSRYGHPRPTPVPLGHRPGKAILVSGHDIHDLEALLEQSAGKGIDVYTHGEMLPAHGYPKLKERFPHLYAHYGTAWQNQIREFAKFPGAILMTTNCLIQPRDSYLPNLFTTNEVGWEGVMHVEAPNFGPVIERALELPGFRDDAPGKTVMCGFAHDAVLGVADKVVEGVKSGAIRHFFLVGGCDGAKPGRNYYTDFVDQTPDDTVVMTLACGKFRFFDHELGKIGGLPRLMDVGQCNDAYSAVKIALALADAFECGVNDLPLTLVISWFEQKAVAVLLTLLALGVKGIKLGPTLPAFVTPNVLNVLVERFELAPIATPEEDLAAALAS